MLFLIKRKYDFIILYGVGNSIFIPFLKLMKYPVIAVVDGADWERKKWGFFAKIVLKISRILAVKYSNFYVVDNEILAKEYEKRFNKKAVYIPYGANTNFTNDVQLLKEFGLIKKKYIIFVGRFVKEKGIDFLISNFEKVTTEFKLVIVGDNNLDIEYVKFLKSTKDKRIIFTGFLFGSSYETLLHNALFYVSCSFLEGTSPSLLSAMAINGFALVSNLKENIEVLKSSCATFKVGDALDFQKKLLYYLTNTEIVEYERIKTREIVSKYYNWDKITEQYIQLFNSMTN
jgi:glycosyltransferase involved in cell wall biosynthesis